MVFVRCRICDWSDAEVKEDLDQASKADGLNFAEIRERVRLEEGGRPVRKRGYYRALKRERPWALIQKMSFDVMNDLSNRLYFGEYEEFEEGES